MSKNQLKRKFELMNECSEICLYIEEAFNSKMQGEEEINREEGRGDEEGDRFSGLPLQLQAAILSLLPVEEAVRATVLSRSWTNVWTHFDHLNLNINPAKYKTGRLRRLTQPFKPLLDSLAHHNVGIRSLSLSEIKNISILNPQRGHVEDDQWSLFSKFLEVLEVRNAKFPSSSTFQRCVNLKVLKFSQVVVKVRVLEAQIFPHCKALESLSFSCCVLRGAWKPSKGSAPPLIRKARKAYKWARFSISAPINLKSLELDRISVKGGYNALSIKALGLYNLTLRSPYFYFSKKVDVPQVGLELDTPQLVALQVMNGIDKLDVLPYPRLESRINVEYYHLTSTHVLHLFLTSPSRVRHSIIYAFVRAFVLSFFLLFFLVPSLFSRCGIFNC
ncbi:hypothetical protein DM860_005104 [Cuscuta australis]|uniref:F-box domain-containing protein n=1 Tax=Cuscuta australis TaxID=267555 RepID=A0A328DMD2_9ASTE|nr:hypothetical protein DM860_005104 [Cuscuta australis]